MLNSATHYLMGRNTKEIHGKCGDEVIYKKKYG